MEFNRTRPKKAKEAKTTKPNELTATKKDEKLAEDAFVKIQTIILEHRQNALLDVAQYLFETFFDKNIELMKTRTPADNRVRSYKQLIDLLQASDIGSPKKTSMYDAIGVYVDTKTLEQEDSDAFRTYGNLSISHKVRLRTVKMKDKIALIQACEEKKYSVRELAKAITKKKGKSTSKKRTYKAELQHIKKELKKGLRAVKRQPDGEKEKVNYKVIESTIEQMINKIDVYL